jgi:anti-sigma regulatory factor (Ser/Thr protein kinase)
VEPLEVHASLGLAREPSAPAAARRFISDFCTAASLGEELCQTAALLTSELVTNAIRYGGSRAVLEARLPGGALRVSVHDDNPRLPEVGNSPALTDEGGRGVLLVSTLADRWGIEPDATGKAIWFELDVR